MFPLPEEYLNSTCEIKTLDNSPITTGVLSRMLENRFIITNQSDKLPVIHCKTILKVNISGTGRKLKVLIGKVYLSTPGLLLLTDMKTVAEYEKRNFFRVKVDIPTKALIPSLPETDEEPPEPFDITVSNLSISGAAFHAPVWLKVGDPIQIYFMFYQTEILLDCKIRRVISPFSKGVGEYGCRFIDRQGRDFDLVAKYIFDCQRAQIKAMKQSASELE